MSSPFRVPRAAPGTPGTTETGAAGPFSSTELATWPAGPVSGHAGPDVSISLDRITSPVGYPARPGFERYLLPLAGTGGELRDEVGACIVRLRRGEVVRVPGEDALRVHVPDGELDLLAATVRTGSASPSFQLLELWSMTMKASLKIGTRASKLALWQANWVKSALIEKSSSFTVDLVTIKTKGDKILDVPLANVGGKGLFVKEIEEALLDGRVDLAVHSMKDMPAELPQGLCIGPIPKRETPTEAEATALFEEMFEPKFSLP